MRYASIFHSPENFLAMSQLSLDPYGQNVSCAVWWYLSILILKSILSFISTVPTVTSWKPDAK